MLLGFIPLTIQAQTEAWNYVAPTWSPKLQVNQIESSNYPEITIYASATYAGKPMDGLAKSDFRVREGGRDQPIFSVEARRDPLSVLLLLDVSGSMRGSLPAAQEAAIEFIRTLAPHDKVEVMTFHERIDSIYRLGSDFAAAERAILATKPLGDTALYDGINEALSVLQKISGRRAVIVLSDGVDDNGSGNQLSKNDIDVPILRAMVSNIPVYTIGLGTNMDEGILRSVSGSTGAEYISSPSANQLLNLYRELGKKLAGQYAIRYRSTSVADGSIRGIDLDYVIPSSKPFASPRAIIGDGNVLGYRSPDLTREQNSRLARLSGLPELHRRYNLPKFKTIDIEPDAFWPEWLPTYRKVLQTKPIRQDGYNEVLEFTTTDSEVMVTQELRDDLVTAGWTVQTHTSLANISTLESTRENRVLTIAAVRENGRTRVVAEHSGEATPIYIGAIRKEQIFNAEGRDVVVSGSYSKIRILGQCQNLTVTGEGNRIEADTVQQARISGYGNTTSIRNLGGATLAGDKNRIDWKNGIDGNSPKVKDLGIDNLVDRKE